MSETNNPVYFSPINVLGNYVYRHFMLSLGADKVFSELMIVSKFSMDEQQRKFKIFEKDIPNTIFQIGVNSVDDVIKGVNYVNRLFDGVKEININMGCPQSTMQKSLLCSGVMFHPKMMGKFSKALVDECVSFDIIPSVKMRLGTSPEDDDLEKYIQIIVDAGIKKIYIHTRFLRYNYAKPALYDKVKSLNDKFPEIEFIFNGDVDSWNRFEELVSLGSKGALVGRAALHNPLIFKQIKEKVHCRVSHFNPIENDSYLTIKDGHYYLSKTKLNNLLEFVDLCKTVNELEICKKNLLYMIKGMSNRGEITQNIQNASSLDEISSLLKTIETA